VDEARHAPDFKNINRIQLSGAPSLDLIQAGGEFKRGVVTDGKEVYALATYGKILGINRQTIINDDMNAFTRLPAALRARRGGHGVGHRVGHHHHQRHAADDGLRALRHRPRQPHHGRRDRHHQHHADRHRPRGDAHPEGPGGPADQRAAGVPHRAGGEGGRRRAVHQPELPGDAVEHINPYAPGGRNPLTPIAEPRLDASSTASWYLAADPAQIDTIEYSYLEGQEGVYMESRMGWDVDGMELKVREDFAAKALDYRGLWKASGT
jgi:hypothetical protein